MLDALTRIEKYSMFKVLDVNLKNGTFKTNQSFKKTELLRWKLVQEEIISKEFKETFLKLTDLSYLKNHLQKNKDFIISYKYKSKTLDKYKWNMLKITPSNKKNHLYLYVYSLDEGNLC